MFIPIRVMLTMGKLLEGVVSLRGNVELTPLAARLSHLGSFFLFDLCPYDKYDNTYRGKVNDFLRIGVLRRKELSSVLILSKLSGFKVSNWPAPG